MNRQKRFCGLGYLKSTYKALFGMILSVCIASVLMAVDTSAWGTIPSTEADYRGIGEVLCVSAKDGAVDYSDAVFYYNTSGVVVGYQKYVNTNHAQTYTTLDLNNPEYTQIRGGCDAILDNLQRVPSPIEKWNRSDDNVASFLVNPSGGANYFLDNPPTISVSPTVCELSWNPELEGAITTCDVAVNGGGMVPATFADAYFNEYGLSVEQIDDSHFRIRASNDKIFDSERTDKVWFYLSGTPAPGSNLGSIKETNMMKAVEVKRVDRYDGGGGDSGEKPWKAEVTEFLNCNWGGALSGAGDNCITLTGEGLQRDDGSHYSVTPTVLETNDTDLVATWSDESNYKFYVKISDTSMSYAKIQFCINDENGNPTDNCRTVTIGSESNLGTPVSAPGAFGDVCNSSAGVFSWIVCPLVEWLRGVVEWTYDQVNDQLVMRPGFYGAGSAVYDAWKIFRDMANVALVALMIMIIVSQITGLGIDNYGIKRMLPRLIVVGILVNLSFIVCQLVVDVSNIVGGNLFQFLANLGPDMSGMGDGQETVMGIVVIAIIGTIAMFIFNPIVLLSLGLSLLGAVIGIFFMFLLLGVRQAAVVLFMALAPLAFVANILPNTQALFKRWWNVFKTLLILFPICGLVMGGGTFAAKLMFEAGGGMGMSEEAAGQRGTVSFENAADNMDGLGFTSFVFCLVGLILMFVPVFFIPKLTKGAFDGLGKIGGAIAGLGGKFSGTVKGKVDSGIRNSEKFKSYEARRQKDIKLAKAGDYTGKNPLRRLRSRINTARAKTDIPILRSNVSAEMRGKRYNHMNEAGEYDGAVATRDENEQMQGILAGSIRQSNGRKYREEDEYREEEYVDLAGDGTVKKRKIPTGKKIRVADGYNSTTDKNVIESHTGGMTSTNSRNTFDKFIADMNAQDIKNAGPEFVGIRNMYRNMATLDSSMSTSDQARTMYDGFVSSYKSLGRSDASAQEDAKQQLGFDATEFGTVSQDKLDAFKYEARRRTSEINKREGKANTEEIVESLKGAMGEGGMDVPH